MFNVCKHALELKEFFLEKKSPFWEFIMRGEVNEAYDWVKMQTWDVMAKSYETLWEVA